MIQPAHKLQSPHPLDAMTHGAFSAATSGERASRIREWLASSPSGEELNQVFKELSGRDKGAAKPVREKLDELKRVKGQESLAAEWATRGSALLDSAKLNIADALAWQRDAAKAGAPLSREPLAAIKTALAERVRGIEDLHHRVMVQREAAVLLAQRVEMLSTKPWREAQAAHEALGADVVLWQEQAVALPGETNWSSVDAKYPPQLDASKAQLLAVWAAFEGAMAQAQAAATDPAAVLPAVPVWAEELRASRQLAADAAAAANHANRPAKPKVDPELRAQASALVQSALELLESEIAQGHGKASTGAANNLRNALREHARLVDDRLEARSHAALAAASELEGWQRWRADQLRDELLGKAEALLQRPEGQALGGRKMQETLRSLREQWKQTDQGGVPNHALWKRFDEACNEAYKVVEAWLERIKAQAAEHRAQRLALVDELKVWGAEHAASTDWKFVLRGLNQFADRWQDAGHLGDKSFTELQAQWNKAIEEAAAGLETARARSLAHRQSMIDEAVALGAAPELRIDAVRELQQRWQLEAQSVPLERRQEQKLWDSFRKPIDDAFQRKTLERERMAAQRMAQMSEQDRRVLDASRRLDEASAQGDAQKVRAAMHGLEAALRGDPLPAPGPAAPVAAPAAAELALHAGSEAGADTVSSAHAPGPAPEGDATALAAPSAVAAPVKPARPVVAVRGDDRPGMKRAEPASARGARGGFGDRGQDRGSRKSEGRRDEQGSASHGRPGRDGPSPSFDRGPRLGDEAFRAQREALERAEMALRKLAMQAHGEVVTGLLGAWEKRDPESLPAPQALGRALGPGARASWLQALRAPAESGGTSAAELLTRLEIGAEIPSPAEHQASRRAMQLFLLTKRHEPSPAQTWGEDVAKLLACGFDSSHVPRAQAVLKALFRR